MFDMTWSSCATYASPCGELKEKLLKPLEIKMSENIDRVTNLPPNAYEQSRKIYEEQCKIRDLHWKICNMDCKELERRLSEILADIDRVTGKFKQNRFQRPNTTIQTGPTNSGDPYEILKKEEKKKQDEQDKAIGRLLLWAIDKSIPWHTLQEIITGVAEPIDLAPIRFDQVHPKNKEMLERYKKIYSNLHESIKQKEKELRERTPPPGAILK